MDAGSGPAPELRRCGCERGRACRLSGSPIRKSSSPGPWRVPSKIRAQPSRRKSFSLNWTARCSGPRGRLGLFRHESRRQFRSAGPMTLLMGSRGSHAGEAILEMDPVPVISGRASRASCRPSPLAALADRAGRRAAAANPAVFSTRRMVASSRRQPPSAFDEPSIQTLSRPSPHRIVHLCGIGADAGTKQLFVALLVPGSRRTMASDDECGERSDARADNGRGSGFVRIAWS